MRGFHVDSCFWDVRTEQSDGSLGDGSLSHQVACRGFNIVQSRWCYPGGEDGDQGLFEEEEMGTKGCLRRKRWGPTAV